MLTGGKEEGIEGFFKGIGKGLLGLLTKPTGGAVDMVSMAFDGIRRYVSFFIYSFTPLCLKICTVNLILKKYLFYVVQR